MMLLIPVEGLVQIRTLPLPHEEMLTAAGGRGPLASVTMEVDNRPIGKVFFLHEPEGEINERARDGMATLTSVHMVFRGPVLMTDIDEQECLNLLEVLNWQTGKKVER